MGRRKRPHLGSFQVWSGLRFVRLPEPCGAGPGSDFPGPWLEGRLPATCRGNLKAPGSPPLVFLFVLRTSNSERTDCRKNLFPGSPGQVAAKRNFPLDRRTWAQEQTLPEEFERA